MNISVVRKIVVAQNGHLGVRQRVTGKYKLQELGSEYGSGTSDLRL